MARLWYSLSTLHEVRHRPRARLVSGWLLAFTVGDSNPVDRFERFLFATFPSSSPRLGLALAGRTCAVLT